MNRIEARFQKLKQEQRKALVPFVTAGDPVPSITVELLHRLVDAGADILELGVPFSDPMADGPVIQRASERALAHHVSLKQVLAMVREFRERDQETPIVLMGYLNPVEVLGYESFSIMASEAGVDGVLIVDLPPEEAEPFLSVAYQRGLAPIFLLAPTTGPERMEVICRAARGFVYYVAVKGVTGARHLDTTEVADRVTEIRQHTVLPVGVGFGIKDGDSAARVAQVADAVIVGSALVQRIENLRDTPERVPAEAAAFVADLRRAMDATGGKE